MIVLGLTGSIGMGKSTAGQMFSDRDIPIISADEIVHQLYSGEAAPLIEAAFPGTVEDGVVNRVELSHAVLNNEEAFKMLEAIVHPLVETKRMQFVESQRQSGRALVVLDIPLLYEGGGENAVDKVVVVSCDAEQQRERVLRRPGMTEEKFDAILARQVPDAQKRARADFVIDTSGTFEETRHQVDALIDNLMEGHGGHA
ncbi:MAG: dephospho-CoA kinase [Hyphomicrobiales bacterium]|nr:dephospho-CoA kinase [Hyphomicrobiales bacterium]MCP5001341.1 dephospho-CoA kinase [Hyphomicrobiales bacterium]